MTEILEGNTASLSVCQVTCSAEFQWLIISFYLIRPLKQSRYFGRWSIARAKVMKNISKLMINMFYGADYCEGSYGIKSIL